MEDYNRLISAKVLDGYEAMLDNVPQPQMLGGKRMRKFVLPGSTEYDYPGTLSVGRMDGDVPATLGGDFWKEFGDGFPVRGGASHCQGGVVYKGADGKIHSTPNVRNPRQIGGKKFNLGKALKPVAPVAKELGMTLAKEGIKEGVKSAARGGRKPSLKSIGKALKPAAPVAKELGMLLAKEGIKEGVKSAARGGRRKKSVLRSVGKALKSVGKELAPVAKEVFQDVIVPEGKKALRDYIKESLRSKPAGDDGEYPMAEAVVVGNGRKGRRMGADPRTYTPEHLLAQGGVLIRDVPSQFHSSVYPPALASYQHSFPYHDAYGRGRAKLPKSGELRNKARGAIVAEVMKKHGLSLAEASKFVKEKGLY